MTEDNNSNAAAFQREGGEAFPTESNDETTAADSQSEKENKTEGTQSDEGDTNTRKEEDTPFHEHPRWKQREDEWNSRFNDQEKRHQEDLKTIREEFGQSRKDNAQNTKIPAWFGGDQAQWDAYRADRDAEIQSAEDRAIKRVKDEQSTTAKAETDAVKQATEYLHQEIATIQADKALNPTGGKVDADKLLKVVLDNQLIDTQGRWNYRAGWKILNGQTAAPVVKKPDTTEKKEIANASSSNSGGGNDNKPAVATSATFKKDRPW